MPKKCFKLFVKEILNTPLLTLEEWGAYTKIMAVLSDSPLPGWAYYKTGEPITDDNWAFNFDMDIFKWKKICLKLVERGLINKNKHGILYCQGFARHKTYKMEMKKLLARKKRNLRKGLSYYVCSPDDIREIFEYFKLHITTRTRLSSEVRYKITLRLKEFSKAQLKWAIKNAKEDIKFMPPKGKALWLFMSKERIAYYLHYETMKADMKNLKELREDELDKKLEQYRKDIVENRGLSDGDKRLLGKTVHQIYQKDRTSPNNKI